MKRKIMYAVALAMMIIIVCAGCSKDSEDKDLNSEVTSVDETPIASSQALENSQIPEVSQVPEQVFDMPVESEPKIDSTKAVNIALEDAGLSLNKRDFDKIDGTVGASFDDDGYYEVEFKTNTTEYKYEIDCDSGEIIEKKIAPRD